MLPLQKGYMLIDAMAAFFIFAVGAMTVLKLETSMLSYNLDAKLRTSASFQAGKLISVASLDAGNAACYVLPVETQIGCSNETSRIFLTGWLSDTQTTLPGSKTAVPTSVLNPDGTLSVSVFWKLKSETLTHSLSVSGQVQ